MVTTLLTHVENVPLDIIRTKKGNQNVRYVQRAALQPSQEPRISLTANVRNFLISLSTTGNYSHLASVKSSPYR